MIFNAATLSDLARTWGPWLVTVLIALGIKDIGAAAIRSLVKAWRDHTDKTSDPRDDIFSKVGGDVLLAIAARLDDEGERAAARVVRDYVPSRDRLDAVTAQIKSDTKR